ncbi:MAG: hypothetical protein JXB13_13105 [Phycisphaerae bacterium]|nr:hypothetical protein [Phycisphaerae bacterium]
MALTDGMRTRMMAAEVAQVIGTDAARTGLVLAGVLAAVLCGAVVAEGTVRSFRLARGLREDPNLLLEPLPESRLLQAGCSVIGAILVLLAVLGLAVPLELRPGGYRLAALGHASFAFAGGVALFALVWRRWNSVRAELAMGLVTLAVCLVASAFVPNAPQELQRRYPMVFNAMLIALAMMAWLWGWLSGVWRQQLDGEVAWTTTGHMVGPAADFAFQAAGIGLIVALLMAAWPRMGAIGAGDDSLGRMLFGIGGHLLLIFALLAGGRRTGRTRFGRTAAVAVLSLLIFICIRAI